MEKFVPASAGDKDVKFLAVSAHKDDMEMFIIINTRES